MFQQYVENPAQTLKTKVIIRFINYPKLFLRLFRRSRRHKLPLWNCLHFVSKYWKAVKTDNSSRRVRCGPPYRTAAKTDNSSRRVRCELPYRTAVKTQQQPAGALRAAISYSCKDRQLFSSIMMLPIQIYSHFQIWTNSLKTWCVKIKKKISNYSCRHAFLNILLSAF